MLETHNVPPKVWLTYPSEKYESQMGLVFPILEIHVPNHQPAMVFFPAGSDIPHPKHCG